MRFEDALISRGSYPLNDDEVRVVEVWNPNHPSCPFVFYNGQRPFRPLLRWSDHTAASAANLFGDKGS
jgi:hypothetical protein